MYMLFTKHYFVGFMVSEIPRVSVFGYFPLYYRSMICHSMPIIYITNFNFTIHRPLEISTDSVAGSLCKIYCGGESDVRFEYRWRDIDNNFDVLSLSPLNDTLGARTYALQ